MASKKKSKTKKEKLGGGYIFFLSLCGAIVLGFLVFAILVSTNTINCAATGDAASAYSITEDGYIVDANGNYWLDDNGNPINVYQSVSGSDAAVEASMSDIAVSAAPVSAANAQ